LALEIVELKNAEVAEVEKQNFGKLVLFEGLMARSHQA